MLAVLAAALPFSSQPREDRWRQTVYDWKGVDFADQLARWEFPPDGAAPEFHLWSPEKRATRVVAAPAGLQVGGESQFVIGDSANGQRSAAFFVDRFRGIGVALGTDETTEFDFILPETELRIEDIQVDRSKLRLLVLSRSKRTMSVIECDLVALKEYSAGTRVAWYIRAIPIDGRSVREGSFRPIELRTSIALAETDDWGIQLDTYRSADGVHFAATIPGRRTGGCIVVAHFLLANEVPVKHSIYCDPRVKFKGALAIPDIGQGPHRVGL